MNYFRNNRRNNQCACERESRIFVRVWWFCRQNRFFREKDHRFVSKKRQKKDSCKNQNEATSQDEIASQNEVTSQDETASQNEDKKIEIHQMKSIKSEIKNLQIIIIFVRWNILTYMIKIDISWTQDFRIVVDS